MSVEELKAALIKMAGDEGKTPTNLDSRVNMGSNPLRPLAQPEKEKPLLPADMTSSVSEKATGDTQKMLEQLFDSYAPAAETEKKVVEENLKDPLGNMRKYESHSKLLQKGFGPVQVQVGRLKLDR